MRTIYKYKLSTSKDGALVSIHQFPEPIHFAKIDGEFYFWAIVNTDNPIVERRFRILGTGWEIPIDSYYIATLKDSPFIWHLFGVAVTEVV